MHGVKLSHVALLTIAVLIFGITGCGNSEKSDVASLNGTWQTASGQHKLVITSNGGKETISIGQKTVQVTMKEYEPDRFELQASDGSAGANEWKIFRIWDDTGKNFTLKFMHDGQTEELQRTKG